MTTPTTDTPVGTLPAGGSVDLTSADPSSADPSSADRAVRDIADVPAVEIIGTAAVHLMTAAAVKVGLGLDEQPAEQRGAAATATTAEEQVDLGEARILITALAGLVTSAAPYLGHHHAAPLRDGLRSLQLAFREASEIPDEPGAGPGEALTGAVYR